VNRTLGTYIAALAIALLTATPAAAAPKQKPDVAINTRTIEANVTIDPALKAHPDLYRRLLAEGKRELEKWHAAADKDFRENPDMFKDGRSYEFGRAYDQRSAIQGYVSITRNDYSYSGGAHPNHFTDTLLWDAHAHKFINIHPFFKETSANGPALRTLAKAIRDAVVADKKRRGMSAKDANDPTWIGGIKPALTNLGAIALAPSTEPGKSSGLIVYFPPYAVGSYVEGDYIEFVPWTAFKTHRSAAGERLFGGKRPPDDAKRHGE
jgi:hypothetical protein